MARRQRTGHAVSMGTFDGGTATADVGIPLFAPSEGALLEDVTFTVFTAGIGTGTYDLMLEELGGTVAMTAKLATADADAAAGTVLGTVDGTGIGATAKGTEYQVQVTENGTVSTGTIIGYVAWWRT